MPDLPTFPIATLEVVPLADDVIDALGHDPRSPYVEQFWLAVLGPSAVWLLRRLVRGLEESPAGFHLDLAATAAELGLGHRSGRHAPFVRTIERCIRFGALQQVGTTIRVRRKLPPLTQAQVRRLPAHLQEAHRRWGSPPTGPDPAVGPPPVETARGLALALLERGASPDAAESALHARQVHPALAHAAVRWAQERREVPLEVHDQLPPEAA
jgi:hypothetical protein